MFHPREVARNAGYRAGMLLLLACVDPSANPRTAAPAATPDPTETVDAAPDTACGELYAQNELPAFELTLSEQELAALQAEYARRDESKAYHPATFTWHRDDGDETVAAHVRLKGTPMLWRGDKMQMVVSFNESDPDARFHGVRKIALDATWYEPTLLRERLAMSVLRDAGLPHSCANNATLAINGEFYGVYANLEYVDREYLERNFGDEAAGGALWKYGTEATGDEEVELSEDIQAFWRATSLTALDEVTDLDAFLQVVAAEAVLGDADGYWASTHNFYLYEHPERGIVLLPWDLDLTIDWMPYDTAPDRGGGQHLSMVFGDERFVDAVEGTLYDPATLDARLVAWSEQIAEAYEADPNRTHSIEEHDATIAQQRIDLVARHAWLESWVACERNPSQDADLDTVTACADCDDRDPAIPGIEAKNGRDDDCDGDVDEDFDVCTEYSFDGERLVVCSQPRSWAEGVAACEALGGVLGFPTSTDQREMLYFQSLYSAPSDTTWWAGATDAAEDGVWRDPLGEPVTIDYWGPAEPKGGEQFACLAFDSSGFGYLDAGCTEPHPIMCSL